MSTNVRHEEHSIDLGDGVTLHAYGEDALVEKWAQYLHGRQVWDGLSDGARHTEATTMLRVLRDCEVEQAGGQR